VANPTEKSIPDDQIPRGWWWTFSVKPALPCSECALPCHWGWRRQKGDTRFLCEACGGKVQMADELKKDETKPRSVRRQR
jgi:hypothetical protein